MVSVLDTTELRTQDETVLAEFNGNQVKNREVLRFVNDLDAYVDVTVHGTDSTDDDFSDSVVWNKARPVPAGTTREVRVDGPYERYKVTVAATQAPTTGDIETRRIVDDSPTPIGTESLNRFQATNEGKSYVTGGVSGGGTPATIGDGATVTFGIKNPAETNVNLFIEELARSAGGDALITLAVDHDTHTPGEGIGTINKRPDLQIERPVAAEISHEPTLSNPQETYTVFQPGGTRAGQGANTTAAPGSQFPGDNFELDPGQDLAVTFENISGDADYFGFATTITETVIV